MAEIKVDKLKTLLDEFNKIDIGNISIEPTLMDISGYPHFENVCSNILRFFFLTDEVHGLKDLFIKELLKIMGEELSYDITVNEVIREQSTSKGNRLDLIIITDDYLIGIENKIYANLTNDLKDYSNYLNSIKGNRKIIKIVLSLYKIPDNIHGFYNIKYSEFFNRIDSMIGSYWHNANQKYLSYLDDFIKTIRRLEGSGSMNNDLLYFMNSNKDDVIKLYLSVIDLKKELRQRVQNLSSLIQYNEKVCRQWLWRENNILFDDLVHDITVDDAVVAIDTNDFPIGWEIHIWLRKPGTNQLQDPKKLIDWLIIKGMPSDDIMLRTPLRDVYIKKFDDTETVSKQLQDILNKLCK